MTAPDLLSRFLTSSYQQYKEDTKTVAAWLASTARQCGYPEDLLRKEVVQVLRAKKRKSKAKKKSNKPGVSDAAETNDCGSGAGDTTIPAGESSNANGSGGNVPKSGAVSTPPSASPQPSHTYVISVQDFTSLAEFIAAKKKPSLKVPHYFAQSLDQAISVRKEHGTTVHAVRPHDAASDERHSYFVGVLERVKEVLGPSFSTASAGETKPDINVTVELTNMFAGLDIEEPSQQFENAPLVALPERPRPDFAALRRQEEEEAYLAFSLLLDDLKQIRSAVTDVWNEFKIGYFTIMAASLVTNTAIDFARNLEQDLADTLKKYGGSTKMLESVWESACRSKGEDPNRRQRSTDDMNFAVYKEADDLMIPAYQLLDSYVKKVRPGSFPMYNPKEHGRYSASADRVSKSNRERYQEDKSLLMEFFPSLAAFCLEMHPGGTTVEDELIRGSRTIFKTHQIALWNVFSVQIFLDIHHCLRLEVNRGYFQLQDAGKLVQDSIELNRESHESRHLGEENGAGEHLQALRGLWQRIQDHVGTDPMTASYRRLGWPQPKNKYLLMFHPVYCGLLMYSIQASFQELSIAYCNPWGAIESAKHLYLALKKTKLLKGIWTDMEAAMMCQHDYIGLEPQESPTIQTFLRRYLIDMGVSASSFAKDSRGSTNRHSARSKGLREQTALSRVFKHRFCTESRRIDFTADELKKIMEKTVTWEEDWSSDHEEIETQHGPIKLPDLSRPAGHAAARSLRDPARAESLQKLPIPELLKRLGPALQGEIAELAYDYLRLHCFCWQFFETLKNEAHDYLKDVFGFDYLTSESQLPRLTGYIFMDAVKDEDQFPNPFLNRKRVQVAEPQLLLLATDALDSMFEAGAGAMVTTFMDKYGVAFDFE